MLFFHENNLALAYAVFAGAGPFHGDRPQVQPGNEFFRERDLLRVVDQRQRIADRLSSDDPGAVFADTLLGAPARDPRRYSLMMDWSNSEFSRLRLQASHSDSDLGDENAWTLQYIHSIGAHGAHTF